MYQLDIKLPILRFRAVQRKIVIACSQNPAILHASVPAAALASLFLTKLLFIAFLRVSIAGIASKAEMKGEVLSRN